MRWIIWCWVANCGKQFVFGIRCHFHRQAKGAAVRDASPCATTATEGETKSDEPKARGSSYASRAPRRPRPGKARWFAKYFPASVVAILTELRGKRRRRIRDRLLKAFRTRGFAAIRALLLDHPGPQSSLHALMR